MVDYEDEDLEDTCAVCGRHLNPSNRSTTQQELCKECAGEAEGVD